MERRNVEICIYYLEGHKLSECASRFRIGRQRVLQILQAANVWQPYERKRTAFVGVNVSDEAKAAVKKKADELGVSVSKMLSDKIERDYVEATR